MSLVIKLKNIVSPNPFTVSYKSGITPYPLDSGFTSYGGTYSAGTTFVNISGVTINFNITYWFKITDTVTNRYIIENIETNDPIAYTNCCPQPEGINAVCVAIACNPPTGVSAICSDGVTPTPTPTPTATATPTPTPTQGSGDCYTVTYSSVPSDLYVRYRRYSDDIFVDELIQNLETMDNGNGTYTAAICVSTMDGLSNTPTCVQGGIQVTCDPYIWEKGGSCTSVGTCFLT
jgi:hypothetical protein